ncbi:hypothetical protein A3K93_03535 [Acinetobacter sp. NCu2D-2]|nr:hypothetical protein A3K93_03535 [Acinetobacter sp. NCu2D-2]
MSFSASVMAHEEPSASEITVTGDLSFATDYRFRGLSNTSNNIAVQGALNLEHASGLYASLWASNVDLDIGTTIETDFTLGYAFDVSENGSFDVSYTRFEYPGADDEANADYDEFAVIYNHANAVVADDQLSTGVYYSPEYSGKTGQEYYFEAGYQYPLTPKFNIVSGVGYTLMENKEKFEAAFGGNGSQKGYWDYKIGLNTEIVGLGAELVWVDNNLKTDDATAKGAAVFSLSKSF